MEIIILPQVVELNPVLGHNGKFNVWEFKISLALNDRILPASLHADDGMMWMDVLRKELPSPHFTLHGGIIVATGHKVKMTPRMEYIGAVRHHLVGGVKGYLFLSKDGQKDERVLGV